MAARPIVPHFVERFHLKEVFLFLLGAILAVPFWPRRVRLDFGELFEQIVVAIIVVLLVWWCQPRRTPGAPSASSGQRQQRNLPAGAASSRGAREAAAGSLR